MCRARLVASACRASFWKWPIRLHAHLWLQAGEIIKQALTLALVLGAGVAGLLSLQATPVLGIMGVEPDAGELYSLALQFLLIRCAAHAAGPAHWRGAQLACPCTRPPPRPLPPWSRSTAAPAALIVSTCQGAFRGVQDLRTPLLITVATNVLHLGLSIGLIFQVRARHHAKGGTAEACAWTAACTRPRPRPFPAACLAPAAAHGPPGGRAVHELVRVGSCSRVPGGGVVTEE